MGPVELLLHLLNFLLPSLGMAGLLAVCAPWLLPGVGRLSVFVTGSLAAGLVAMAGAWLLERDGRMATYVAMVVVCATAPWLLARLRRR